MSHFCYGGFTNNNPSNMILVTFSTARVWVCGFTSHVDLSSYCLSDNQAWGLSQAGDFLKLCRCTPKISIHFCTHVPCFLNAATLHNSVDRGISKFVYLRLHLVVCFYPWLPTCPWSWGHTYCQISVNECVWSECHCFFNGISKLWIWVSEPWEYHHSRVHHLSQGQELIIWFGSLNNNWLVCVHLSIERG